MFGKFFVLLLALCLLQIASAYNTERFNSNECDHDHDHDYHGPYGPHEKDYDHHDDHHHDHGENPFKQIYHSVTSEVKQVYSKVKDTLKGSLEKIKDTFRGKNKNTDKPASPGEGDKEKLPPALPTPIAAVTPEATTGETSTSKPEEAHTVDVTFDIDERFSKDSDLIGTLIGS